MFDWRCCTVWRWLTFCDQAIWNARFSVTLCLYPFLLVIQTQKHSHNPLIHTEYRYATKWTNPTRLMDSMRYELVQLVFAVFSKTGVDGKICLIDFGDSKIIQPDELYDEFVGTIHVTLSIYSHRWWLVVVFDVQYVPPEIVHKTRSGTCLKKGDMWRYTSNRNDHRGFMLIHFVVDLVLYIVSELLRIFCYVVGCRLAETTRNRLWTISRTLRGSTDLNFPKHSRIPAGSGYAVSWMMTGTKGIVGTQFST